MNCLNVRSTRNGLGSDFFNFVPVGVAHVGGALVAARKIKTKRYENLQTDQLAREYPHKITSEEQNKMLQTLVGQQEKLIEKRDKAKGKARAQVVGRLRAFDEYLTDVRNVRDELAQQEKIALEQLKAKNEEMKSTPSVEEKAQADVVLADVTKSQADNLAEATPKQKNNTLLFVGIGLAIAVILIMRKK